MVWFGKILSQLGPPHKLICVCIFREANGGQDKEVIGLGPEKSCEIIQIYEEINTGCIENAWSEVSNSEIKDD